MTITAAQRAEAVRRLGPDHGLRLAAFVDAKHGSGVLLTENVEHPGAVGLAAVDSTGASAVLALDRDEATALRDALTAWLDAS